MDNPAPRFHCRHRGLNLSYLDSAPGNRARPAVLLLHGFPDEATLWSAQFPALHAAGYRCIAPDTVGCGESDIAPGLRDYRAPAIAGDHLALLDELGVARAHVVGHDWGAVLAWLLAGHSPERVRSLAVLGVGHPTAYARAGLKQKLLAWYTYYFLLAGISDRLLQGDSPLSLTRYFQHPRKAQVLERLRRPGRMTAALRIYRANVATVLLQRHPKPAAPTLGIWAEGDRFLVESQMTRSEGWVTGPWRYRRFPGDHWTPVTEPARLNAALLDHLQAGPGG
ncbi:alpha/beta fold hydrolase [Thioalkalivibrio sp. XN8]|uniref:alpha/beta fold hydrolase n=1 Tax=Thioalkalivibrio sp. XN8 TaxID=2712863 RepID=UPI0013ECC4C7|nr:alpha/beta fold hydrolase [Thioalkalivibrio sp. XN8]